MSPCLTVDSRLFISSLSRLSRSLSPTTQAVLTNPVFFSLFSSLYSFKLFPSRFASYPFFATLNSKQSFLSFFLISFPSFLTYPHSSQPCFFFLTSSHLYHCVSVVLRKLSFNLPSFFHSFPASCSREIYQPIEASVSSPPSCGPSVLL